MGRVGAARDNARTINHLQRRLAEGLSKNDELRCLHLFIACEVLNELRNGLIAV